MSFPKAVKFRSAFFRALHLAGLLVLLSVGTGLHAADASAQAQPKPEAAAPLIVEGRESEELFINTAQGRFRFTAEIADDARERSVGLMHREKMPPTHGMLFVFGETDWVSMWMKNTPLSLDMIFIDRDGKVVTIAERTTPFSTDIISSGEPVDYVLELNGGVSRLIGLKPGDSISHRLFDTEK
jgi:uncharacterized membrane protein (UPF0127 family)